MKNYFTIQKYITAFLEERYDTTDKYLSDLSYKFIADFERVDPDHQGQGRGRAVCSRKSLHAAGNFSDRCIILCVLYYDYAGEEITRYFIDENHLILSGNAIDEIYTSPEYLTIALVRSRE